LAGAPSPTVEPTQGEVMNLDVISLTDVALFLDRLRGKLAGELPHLSAGSRIAWRVGNDAAVSWTLEPSAQGLRVDMGGETRTLAAGGCSIDAGSPWQRPCTDVAIEDMRAVAALLALTRSELRPHLRIESMVHDHRPDGTRLQIRMSLPVWGLRWHLRARMDGSDLQLLQQASTVLVRAGRVEMQGESGERWLWSFEAGAPAPRVVLRKPAATTADTPPLAERGRALLGTLRGDIDTRHLKRVGDVEVVFRVHQGRLQLLGAQWPVLARDNGRDLVASPLAPLSVVPPGQSALLQASSYEAALIRLGEGCHVLAVGGELPGRQDAALVARTLPSCDGWNLR
jgi:hypothetical protein